MNKRLDSCCCCCFTLSFCHPPSSLSLLEHDFETTQEATAGAFPPSILNPLCCLLAPQCSTPRPPPQSACGSAKLTTCLHCTRLTVAAPRNPDRNCCWHKTKTEATANKALDDTSFDDTKPCFHSVVT